MLDTCILIGMKLISLNIEGHKHIDRQLPFFEIEAPDVLCLQEVFEPDVSDHMAIVATIEA